MDASSGHGGMDRGALCASARRAEAPPAARPSHAVASPSPPARGWRHPYSGADLLGAAPRQAATATATVANAAAISSRATPSPAPGLLGTGTAPSASANLRMTPTAPWKTSRPAPRSGSTAPCWHHAAEGPQAPQAASELLQGPPGSDHAEPKQEPQGSSGSLPARQQKPGASARAVAASSAAVVAGSAGLVVGFCKTAVVVGAAAWGAADDVTCGLLLLPLSPPRLRLPRLPPAPHHSALGPQPTHWASDLLQWLLGRASASILQLPHPSSEPTRQQTPSSAAAPAAAAGARGALVAVVVGREVGGAASGVKVGTVRVAGAVETEMVGPAEVVWGARGGATVLGRGVGAGTNSVVEAVEGGGPPPGEYRGATWPDMTIVEISSCPSSK
mmetsp:Transcript_81311/g.212244  ORF Transcript_81311/g.212244 Transcript_81311/m.212244 type:complete len:389 (-) Transcript_81311:1126-2292(-)